MNETQQKNIAVANFIIDELYKEKPFCLELDTDQGKVFWTLMNEQKVYGIHLPVVQKDSGYLIEISESNADKIYHMLSSYIAKHDRFGVVQSLKEVS